MTSILTPEARAEIESLGMSLDMLAADRLRNWAGNIATYGADITQWGDVKFVAATMERLADDIAQAVKDIGRLRSLLSLVESLQGSEAWQDKKEDATRRDRQA